MLCHTQSKHCLHLLLYPLLQHSLLYRGCVCGCVYACVRACVRACMRVCIIRHGCVLRGCAREIDQVCETGVFN